VRFPPFAYCLSRRSRWFCSIKASVRRNPLAPACIRVTRCMRNRERNLNHPSGTLACRPRRKRPRNVIVQIANFEGALFALVRNKNIRIGLLLLWCGRLPHGFSRIIRSVTVAWTRYDFRQGFAAVQRQSGWLGFMFGNRMARISRTAHLRCLALNHHRPREDDYLKFRLRLASICVRNSLVRF